MRMVVVGMGRNFASEEVRMKYIHDNIYKET